jgi:hypothetical protein
METVLVCFLMGYNNRMTVSVSGGVLRHFLALRRKMIVLLTGSTGSIVVLLVLLTQKLMMSTTHGAF